MDRSKLIQEAIKEAYKEIESNTIITNHENGVDTTTRFYKKDKAIWCEMITGCIKSKFRVYKANTDAPYIRDMGCYWKLGEKEKAIVYRLANA